MLQRFRLENNPFEYFVAAFLVLVYAGTFFFPLMDKDAARHANVALHMYQTGDYLRLIDRGNPYLDKPHFLFWSELASFKIFGVNTFAARFPHLLFALLALYSVYKLTKHLSDTTTAKLAALMLGTAQAFVLAIMDARMETPLTAGVAFGLWQLILYVDKKLFQNLILAALGAAIAFSTKGWVGPIIIFTAAFFYMLLQKKWSILTKPKTYLFILLFFLFISPVLYAYYVQFDLHPELVVRGRSGYPGIRYILWEQNFERFQGDTFSDGGRNSGYFFLWHTFLWAFFPWSLIAYMAVFFWVKRLVQKRKSSFSFAAFSFALLLVLISFSNFKMPHYIIMLFPLAALATAPYVRMMLSTEKGARFIVTMQSSFALVLIPVLVLLNFYFFQPKATLIWIIGPLLLMLLAILVVRKSGSKAVKAVYISAALSLVLNFFLNYSFFPSLMQYQAGNELAKMLQEKNRVIPDENIKLLEANVHTFDFHRRYNHSIVTPDSLSKNLSLLKDNYFILDNTQKTQLTNKGFIVEPVVRHADYNVSTLTFTFLNPATRAQKLDTVMLAKIYKP